MFAPVVARKDEQHDRHAPLPGDSQALSQWRQRMGTRAAKLIDRDRAASIECANAHLRNRGLQRLKVRGLVEPRAVVLWHALARHLKRMMALNFAFAARQAAREPARAALAPRQAPTINATQPRPDKRTSARIG